MISRFETSKFLSQINNNQIKKLYTDDNHKYIIKINELQQIIRFINIHIQKMNEKMETKLISIQYIEFLDFINDLSDDIMDLVNSIDIYDTDFINNRLEIILENNLPKNNQN